MLGLVVGCVGCGDVGARVVVDGGAPLSRCSVVGGCGGGGVVGGVGVGYGCG